MAGPRGSSRREASRQGTDPPATAGGSGAASEGDPAPDDREGRDKGDVGGRSRPAGSAPRFPGLTRGGLEVRVLEVLWERAALTTPAIYEAIGAPRALRYTTIARVLDRLRLKGLVVREKVGRTFAYRPAESRADTQTALARGLLERLLGGDPQPALAALVGALDEIDPDLVAALEEEVARRRRRPGDGA